jgi:hypothetical protein
MEDLPRPCFSGAGSDGYAKKHDPFAYFPGRGPCRIVGFGALAKDLRAGHLPSFVWVTPNLCDDGHDCDNAASDRFLAHLVPSLLHSLGPHGVLALTWDEGTSDEGCCTLAHGGRVALVLAGPDVRRGARLAHRADHYSLLRLIEDAFGLPRLRGAGCRCTPTLDDAFRGGSPPRLR